MLESSRRQVKELVTLPNLPMAVDKIILLQTLSYGIGYARLYKGSYCLLSVFHVT